MLLLSQITALLSRKVIAHRDALPATTTTATTRSEIERALLDAARLWKLQLAAAETDRASDILDCLVGPDGTAPVLLEGRSFLWSALMVLCLNSQFLACTKPGYCLHYAL